MPAKAGIQEYQWITKHWTPASAGETTYYEGVKVWIPPNQPLSR